MTQKLVMTFFDFQLKQLESSSQSATEEAQYYALITLSFLKIMSFI